VALDVTDSGIREYYYRGSVPDFNATETDSSNLDGMKGGFVKVPPGMVTLTATPRATSKPSSRATVYVRAGTITYVNLHPTP